MNELLAEAFVKAIPTACVAVVTLLLGWIVGNRISANWDMRKKRRELDLDAVHRFYSLYGGFFAIWKTWAAMDRKYDFGDACQDVRLDLLKRAAALEGKWEALAVKLAVERRLEDSDKVALAKFREGLQCLRESIEWNAPLRVRLADSTFGSGEEWKSSPSTESARDGLPPRAAAYTAFKTLAAAVCDITTNCPIRRTPKRILVLRNPIVIRQADPKAVGRSISDATNTAYRSSWWT